MTTPPIQALKDALGAPFPREEINLSDVAAILEALEVAQMDARRLDYLESLGNLEVLSMYQGPTILTQGDDELGQGPSLRDAADAAIALQEGRTT